MEHEKFRALLARGVLSASEYGQKVWPALLALRRGEVSSQEYLARLAAVVPLECFALARPVKSCESRTSGGVSVFQRLAHAEVLEQQTAGSQVQVEGACASDTESVAEEAELGGSDCGDESEPRSARRALRRFSACEPDEAELDEVCQELKQLRGLVVIELPTKRAKWGFGKRCTSSGKLPRVPRPKQVRSRARSRQGGCSQNGRFYWRSVPGVVGQDNSGGFWLHVSVQGKRARWALRRKRLNEERRVRRAEEAEAVYKRASFARPNATFVYATC